MNKRKFFGTILGIILWSVCVVFFTFAYYEWRSTNTSIVIGINDLSTKCMPGTDVNVENIGPVLNYEDGVISEFSIENGMNKEMAIDLRLDITSISDNLLVESFKYAVVTDNTGGTNYDYDNPVVEGTFENFKVGNNVITTALVLTPSIIQKFQFIVYIDGNMKNDINLQNNNLVANLMIGNCEENATSMDELIYQAIYFETDNSLTFIHNKPVSVGDTYNDKAVTAVYTGFETTKYTSKSAVPWYADGNYQNITSVTFEETVSPVSTAFWFNAFTNLTDIDLEKLDTSKVTNMSNMFNECSNLTNLDVSNFNTSNVTDMSAMFRGCRSLTSLDLSNFNTSNVTLMNSTSYWYGGGIFESCTSLISLDISGFDTSKLTSFAAMFYNCRSLAELDVSNLNTSLATSIAGMFYGCSSLTSLDVSNFDTSNVKGTTQLFSNCNKLIKLDLSNWNTSNVTSMHEMFWNCNSLINLDVSNWNTSSVTNMNYLFYGCSSLISLDVSKWDISSVKNMQCMFWKCNSLKELDLTGWSTSSVTNMNHMFADCSSLTNLDLSGFNTSELVNFENIFQGCVKLVNLNLDGWDTSSIKNYNSTFWGCTKIITSITVSNPNSTYNGYVFGDAATGEGARIVVNYVGDNPDTTDVNESTESLVESMIATKWFDNSKVVKGSCEGDYCPVEETTE